MQFGFEGSKTRTALSFSAGNDNADPRTLLKAMLSRSPLLAADDTGEVAVFCLHTILPLKGQYHHFDEI